MKRIFILFGLLALTIGSQAQMNQHSNYIALNGGGGLNTLMYKPTDGTWNPKLGFLGELKYMHFFGKNFGLGFGVQFNYTRSGATFNFREVTQNLVHPVNGLNYESRTVYNDWKETQTAMFLSVPVEFYWRAPMGERWFFLLGLGAQLDLPMKSEFKADKGTYEVRGYFPATNVEYRDLPNYGFTVYNANEKGDVKDLKQYGISLIADLGFNYAMSNHWGLYFGIYGGYGITDLNEKKSAEPMLDAPTGTTTVNAYNGVINSNQVDEVHLLNVGAKIGINIGWQCHSSKSDNGGAGALVPYDSDNSKGNNNDNNGNNNYDKSNNGDYNNPAYGSDEDDAAREAEEAAAREARCNARRMNNPDMAAAIANIDADIAEAEQAANETNDAAAKAAVANAKNARKEAQAAYDKGNYCQAYDLFNEAYGYIADSYANDARNHADKKSNNETAQQAADDAALYAEASHKDGLDCAMAASRNAKINSEIARDADKPERNSAAYNDPNFANNLANEAIAMAEQTGSKPAMTDGKDASGKAYRGNLPESYAAAAKSFAESGEACAAKNKSAEAQAAVKEAKAAAAEAAEAARMGNTAAAYRAAIHARDAAQRACGIEPKPAEQQAANKPAPNRAELQSLLDLINATVHFEFAKTDPQFDNATEIAINSLCAAMKADKNIKILVTGHTDNVGSAEGNMTYGKKRAEALKALMVKRGAPASQISTATRGEEEPVVENDTEEHRYQNRRAVITLK